MNDGHNELQHAIDAWETRRVAAMRAAREAEIVLPFLRAAVEELEAFVRSGNIDAPVATTTNVEQLRTAQTTTASDPAHAAPALTPESVHAPEPVAVRAEEPSPAVEFEGNDVVANEDDNEPQHEEDSFAGFGRKSIASLIDEANRDKEATG